MTKYIENKYRSKYNKKCQTNKYHQLDKKAFNLINKELNIIKNEVLFDLRNYYNERENNLLTIKQLSEQKEIINYIIEKISDWIDYKEKRNSIASNILIIFSIIIVIVIPYGLIGISRQDIGVLFLIGNLIVFV